ncbi:MFS transporter [Actinokineospora sp. NPDC004072]
MTETGYRSIATKAVFTWAAAALANKLPIAMAPLAFVFLARDLPGGYTLGATLAAVWVFAEVVAAPVLGMWFKPEHARWHLAGGLAVGAAAFAALAIGRELPTAALVVFAFLAGVGPAASPSGLRALLTAMVSEKDAAKALSAETVLISVVWALAPAVVAFLALAVSPSAPVALGAALNVVTILLVFRLPPGRPAEGPPPGKRAMGHTLLSAWPIYLTAAASMAMVSTMELALPALLESRELAVGWVGPLLTVFWVTSVIGAYVYGRRSWPGTARGHSLVCLLATIAAVAAVALLPTVIGMGVALAIGGLFQACVLITRNLSLRDRLPEAAHTAGYSIMYATTGVGYGITAATTATVMATTTPAAAILGGGVIVLILVLASALAERRQAAAAQEAA